MADTWCAINTITETLMIDEGGNPVTFSGPDEMSRFLARHDMFSRGWIACRAYGGDHQHVQRVASTTLREYMACKGVPYRTALEHIAFIERWLSGSVWWTGGK